jgi:hypothetical protein
LARQRRIRSGRLSGGAPEECVAVVVAKGFASLREGTAVLRLVILRDDRGRWPVVFEAGRQLRNSDGYVGLDYIDDAFDFRGYRLKLGDKGCDGAARFTLVFWYLTSEGADDGLSIEVGWNRATGRYQEFDCFSEAPVFKTELKNPPHRRPLFEF